MRHFGLIGKPLSHSHSADYFNAKFRAGDIDADYTLYPIDSVDEVAALASALSGFNVTIPYKCDIVPLLNAIDPTAEAIGAVNCVKVLPDGRLHGFNTDAAGIAATLDQAGIFAAPHPAALILGTGGAAAAVRHVLQSRGIDSLTVSRRYGRGDCTYAELTPETVAARTLIINATPVGMFPHTEQCPPLPYSAITPGHTLFDLIYNPAQTEFLRRGQAVGARTINGETMFRRQAEESWRIWNND